MIIRANAGKTLEAGKTYRLCLHTQITPQKPTELKAGRTYRLTPLGKGVKLGEELLIMTVIEELDDDNRGTRT